MEKLTHLDQIGKNIRDMRVSREMTQRQLAELSGLRLATISEIENGKANFQFNTLVRIASALKCKLHISIA